MNQQEERKIPESRPPRDPNSSSKLSAVELISPKGPMKVVATAMLDLESGEAFNINLSEGLKPHDLRLVTGLRQPSSGVRADVAIDNQGRCWVADMAALEQFDGAAEQHNLPENSSAGSPDPYDVISKLVKWAEHMGGWEAPCWREAAQLLDNRRKPASTQNVWLNVEAKRIAGLLLEGDDETVLDSVVHDKCSALATGINNDGAEAQVKYLLSNGWSEATILKEAGVESAPVHN